MEILNLRNIERISIVVLLFIIFLQNSCEHKPTYAVKSIKQKVIIPEKVGKFDKPTSTVSSESKKDSIKWYETIVKVQNPINKKLAEDFIKAQKERDSLKTLNLYLTSIGEQEKTYTFEDKFVKIDVNTKTRGELLNITSDYKIKSNIQEVEVKQKETTFAVYTGVSFEYITDLERLSPKLTLGLQNKKGDIFSIGAGMDKSIQVGYSFRILNIKK